MKPRKKPGPCPDPDRYVFVHRKNGGYWRKKRGTDKPAVLNEAFAANAKNTSVTIPAARRLLERLDSFTACFIKDLRLQRVATLFNRDLKETGELTYRLFPGFEMQQKYPLEKIYRKKPFINVEKKMMEVIIDLNEKPVVQRSPVATHYYFELIMITGDPAKENSLRVESDGSNLYEFKQIYTDKIRLSMQLPNKKPWVMFLKCGCMQGFQPAPHMKNYGMKVVGVG